MGRLFKDWQTDARKKLSQILLGLIHPPIQSSINPTLYSTAPFCDCFCPFGAIRTTENALNKREMALSGSLARELLAETQWIESCQQSLQAASFFQSRPRAFPLAGICFLQFPDLRGAAFMPLQRALANRC